MESRPPSIGACGDDEDDNVGNAKDEDDEDGRWPEGEIVRRGASIVGGRFRRCCWALWVCCEAPSHASSNDEKEGNMGVGLANGARRRCKQTCIRVYS